jgi:hypothetical protein
VVALRSVCVFCGSSTPPGDVLRVGLTVLAALTWLCMIGSASVLAGPRSPEQGAA